MGPDRLADQAPIDRIRAFFGLPLPAPQRADLTRYLEARTAAAPEFRWVLNGNLHLTLRFVAAVERGAVEGVADRLVGSAGPAFDLALGDAGSFRRGRLVRVVYLGVREGTEPMRALAGRVEAECRAAGLEPETRPFKPHLTLARARARDGAPPPDLPWLPALEPWKVEELILYSSHLQKGGAVHEPIRSIPLT